MFMHTEMVRRRMAAVPLDTIVGQPTLPAVRKLVEQLSAFAAHFHTTEWGGRHGHLALVLNQQKMRVATGDANLNYDRLLKPALVNPTITDATKGRDLIIL